MHKKLLVALSLIAGHAMAMELAVDNEQATPTDTTEKKVVITIQGQERELPARLISLIGALDLLCKEGTSLQMSPITLVSFDTWQLIEDQLERVYAITQGNQQVRDEIIADYSQLETTRFIDLIRVVHFLTIPPLLEIILELAQEKPTSDEILELPELVRNEVIKRKARIAGPIIRSGIADVTNHERKVDVVCVTHDGKIVFGLRDATVRVWDMNGQELAVCRGHEDKVTSVCVTSDGKIVSGSRDATVRVWNMNGEELVVCRRHEGWVTSVDVTSDSKIISGSFDGTVSVWDMNGQELAVCRGHEGGVTSVCVTSDDKIVSGSLDNTVRVWAMNGKELALCWGHGGWVASVCVTSDDKIVSGSEDKTVRVWDSNGEELAICRGHGDWVTSVCVTSNDRIVSGSGDETVRVWDSNGEELAIYRGHEAAITSVCVTSDDKIVSGSWDKTVRVWDSNMALFLMDRLSVMSKEQAKLVFRMLKLTERVLGRFDEHEEYDARYRISQEFWQEIAKILEEEELVVETKKRKELENSDNNPAKKVRLLEEEELVIESK